MKDSSSTAFAQLCALHESASVHISRTLTADRLIDWVILLLSGLTAVCLWTLIARDAPVFAEWTGAVCASIATVLQLVQGAPIGPKRRLEKLLPLFKRQALALGKFRDGDPIGWTDVKEFMAEMAELGVTVREGPPVKSAAELAAMSPQERLAYEQLRQQFPLQ